MKALVQTRGGSVSGESDRNISSEELADKYQEDSQGLEASLNRRRDEVSVDYVQSVRDLEDRESDSEEIERVRNNLRQERDYHLDELSERYRAAREIISSREPETDYSD